MFVADCYILMNKICLNLIQFVEGNNVKKDFISGFLLLEIVGLNL